MTTTIPVVDVPTLRRLVRSAAPTASVYVGLLPPEATLDAEEDLGLRWRLLAARLAEQGADAATLQEIGRHISNQQVSPAAYAVLAAGGTVRFAGTLPGGPTVDRATFGAPADVMPLLAWLDRRPPHVVVVADRTGADVTAVRRGAVTGSVSTVVGPDDEIERNAPGGWSQPRYQRRAEDSWEHNAVAVAHAVSAALRRVGGGLLLVAGDVRAVQLLRDRLPDVRRGGVVLREIPGGRGVDGSDAVRHAAIERAVAEFAEARLADLTDRFVSGWRPDGNVVEGLDATLGALAEGRVHTLLIADDPDDERRAWFGPDTLCIGPDQPTRAAGLVAGRLPGIAVRAALLTGADVCVLPVEAARTIGDGIGGLCRFGASTGAGLTPRLAGTAEAGMR